MAEPVRILHVVGGMNRAGTETWLMQVLRRIDRTRFHFDFLVHLPTAGDYDEEIRALGGRILCCPWVSQPWRYATCFLRLARANGPYDVVHGHVHFFSGYVLWLAALAGIPRRIAHSHTTADDRGRALPRRLFRFAMQRLINRYATRGVGVSRAACAALFGPNWQADARFQALHIGLDLEPFAHLPRREDVRHLLGIPQDAWVVGHVGRLVAVKNHAFILEVAAQVLAQRADAWFLLVGDGPLRPQVEQRVHDLGIAERVVFAGVRADVPAMMAAMDVFLFPSFHEGLPGALLESQAAGLRCVVSDVVTREADAVPALIQRLPLAAGASTWAEALLGRTGEETISREAALKTMRESDLNLETAMPELLDLYLE